MAQDDDMVMEDPTEEDLNATEDLGDDSVLPGDDESSTNPVKDLEGDSQEGDRFSEPAGFQHGDSGWVDEESWEAEVLEDDPDSDDLEETYGMQIIDTTESNNGVDELDQF